MLAKRLSHLIVLLATLVPVGATAQSGTGIHLAAGPAYRFRAASSLTGERAKLDGVAVNVALTVSLAGRLHLIVGVGGYWGESASAQFSDDPCNPGPCAPPNPSPGGHLSGKLFHARLGVGMAGDHFSSSVGIIGGHVGDGLDPAGAGVFAEARILPFRSLRGLTIGVMGLVLDPAPGGTRALITPSIGWQF